METIPEEHKVTIRRLVEADPEVARATCEIPHSPTILLRKPAILPDEIQDPLPFCGCFVGIYAWMQECKHGEEISTYFNPYNLIDKRTGIPQYQTSYLASWCYTVERDEAAVEYAMSLLEN